MCYKFSGMNCNVNGSWASKKAGVIFNIIASNYSKNNLILVKIRSKSKDYQYKKGFLNTDWSCEAFIPFRRVSVIVLVAQNNRNKNIAVFVGTQKLPRISFF